MRPLDRERRAGEGYSEVILRLVEVDATVRWAEPGTAKPVAVASTAPDLAVRARERQLLPSGGPSLARASP